jgi:ATP-binding cassette, subfamily B, bacterial PglK
VRNRTAITRLVQDFGIEPFMYLSVFSVFISFIEMAGIASVFPFIELVTNPEILSTNSYYSDVYMFVGEPELDDLIITTALLLVVFFILKVFLSYKFLRYKTTVLKEFYRHLYYKVYVKYTNMRYVDHQKGDSSRMLKNITSEIMFVNDYISSLINLFTELALVISIFTLIMFVNLKVAVGAILILSLKTIVSILIIKPIQKRLGIERESTQEVLYSTVNSTLQNIKAVKVFQVTEYFQKIIFTNIFKYAKLIVHSLVLSELPKYILELLGFIAIIFVFTYGYYDNGFDSFLPLMTMLALAFYKLLPSANKIISAYSSLAFNEKALHLIHDELYCTNDEITTRTKCKAISNFEKITFHNVECRIDNIQLIDNISFEINKGEKIALIGESGSGKTTIIDIILGLKQITSGEITINDDIQFSSICISNWLDMIGYVPQEQLMLNSTLKQNIIFGRRDRFDDSYLINLATRAGIDESILKNRGLNFRIGELGSILSGGQRQRVSIARALYNSPELLIFDEAFSALDKRTQKMLFDSIITNSDSTILFVTHDQSLIKYFDRVIEL